MSLIKNILIVTSFGCLNLKAQYCTENAFVFKKDSTSIALSQNKCLKYYANLFYVYKKFDNNSEIKLTALSCKDELKFNNKIGEIRGKNIMTYFEDSCKIKHTDILFTDKLDDVNRYRSCEANGGIIQIQITMTKPINKKLAKELSKIKIK